MLAQGGRPGIKPQPVTCCVLAGKPHAGWLQPDLVGCERVFTNFACVGCARVHVYVCHRVRAEAASALRDAAKRLAEAEAEVSQLRGDVNALQEELDSRPTAADQR